jgi:hypothetical protein
MLGSAIPRSLSGPGTLARTFGSGPRGGIEDKSAALVNCRALHVGHSKRLWADSALRRARHLAPTRRRSAEQATEHDFELVDVSQKRGRRRLHRRSVRSASLGLRAASEMPLSPVPERCAQLGYSPSIRSPITRSAAARSIDPWRVSFTDPPLRSEARIPRQSSRTASPQAPSWSGGS